MLKKIKSFLLVAAMLTVTACSGGTEGEIKIPIYNDSGDDKLTTEAVQYRDLSQTKNIGGEIGYLYAEDVCTQVQGNLIEFCVERNQQLKAGDTIAVIDSSAMDYDYQSQKILTDNAYNNYTVFGGEHNRLIYEQNKAILDSIQYEIDRYTIKAPYDCIVTSINRYDVGSFIDFGKVMCTVAKSDEVYVYTTSDTKYFSLGAKVEIKLTTNERYSGTVVMTPQTIKGNESYGSLVSRGVNINKAAVIELDGGELERLLTDIPNAISAGWATIYATSAEKNHVLTVPDSAVKKYSGSLYCYIYENGQKIQIPIEAGDSINGYTVILSGLSEGQIVII